MVVTKCNYPLRVWSIRIGWLLPAMGGIEGTDRALGCAPQRSEAKYDKRVDLMVVGLSP